MRWEGKTYFAVDSGEPGPEELDSEESDSEAMDSEAVDSLQMDSFPNGIESRERESSASESCASESCASESCASESSASESSASESIASEVCYVVEMKTCLHTEALTELACCSNSYCSSGHGDLLCELSTSWGCSLLLPP